MKIDLRYLAGFIDGEGWIGVYKSKGGSGIQKSDRYVLEVGIGQTLKGLPLFESLAERYGGNVSQYQPKSKNAKRQCKFIVVSERAKKLLKDVYPYLILKKEQAKLGIEFQDLKGKDNSENNNFRGRLIPKKIISRREKTYQKMKVLNKKGTCEV